MTKVMIEACKEAKEMRLKKHSSMKEEEREVAAKEEAKMTVQGKVEGSRSRSLASGNPEVTLKLVDGVFMFLADPAKHRRPGWPLTGSGGKDLKEEGIATCLGMGATAG